MKGRSPPPGNPWAAAALFTVITSWTLLAARIAVEDLWEFDSVLDYIYAATVAGGVALSAAGLLAVRRRGEAVLAVATLVLSLALPFSYAALFVLLHLLLGDRAELD